MPSATTMAITTAVGAAIATHVALARPLADFRVLRADPRTAVLLAKAVDGGQLDAHELGTRLDELVAKGTVEELARFRQRISPRGEILDLVKDPVDIEIADGEMMPGGIRLEAEPHVGGSGLVDVRFAIEHRVEVRRNRVDSAHTLAASTVRAGAWEILCEWGDHEDTDLLMVRFSGDMEDPGRHGDMDSIRELSCMSELRHCDAGDLETFGRSTPATRQKALAWLRERGELIASSGLRLRSGQRAAQHDLLEWIHDDGGWTTARLGLTLQIDGTIGPRGRLVDLVVEAAWHPPDARRPPGEPEFKFLLADSTVSGGTLLVEPAARPDKGPIPVLFVTPQVNTLHEAPDRSIPAGRPDRGLSYIRVYPVHPSFMRRLAENTRPARAPAPGVFIAPVLDDMLKQLGMDLPKGTQVSFDPRRCAATLVHGREGHEAFAAILDKWELALPAE